MSHKSPQPFFFCSFNFSFPPTAEFISNTNLHPVYTCFTFTGKYKAVTLPTWNESIINYVLDPIANEQQITCPVHSFQSLQHSTQCSCFAITVNNGSRNDWWWQIKIRPHFPLARLTTKRRNESYNHPRTIINELVLMNHFTFTSWLIYIDESTSFAISSSMDSIRCAHKMSLLMKLVHSKWLKAQAVV